MSDWKPRVRPGARLESLSLTGEEGFVLSRIDGSTSVKQLVQVTGLPEGRVQQIVGRLVDQGAVDSIVPAGIGIGAGMGEPSSVGNAARRSEPVRMSREEREQIKRALTDATGDDLASLLADSGEGDPVVDAPAGKNHSFLDTPQPQDGGADPWNDETNDDEALPGSLADELAAELAAVDPAAIARDADDEPMNLDDGAKDDDGKADVADGDRADADDDSVDKNNKADVSELDEKNYRKLFEMELHPLPEDERLHIAKGAKGATLLALCFDPLHSVIRAVFDNTDAGFPHARLVARHHRTPQGLDVVMGRNELLRDGQVQRELLKNPMLQDPQLKKILQPKRLLVVYKTTIDRELPERNRQKARQILRGKWTQGASEERADIVWSTEGRVLNQLIGLPIDSRTTTFLCQRTYTSLLMIQNLARFSSTPPQLLVHLLKQQVVRRTPQLKQLIFQHPNCPGDAKRRG